MDDPQVLTDPDTDETYVACPNCERVTLILDMIDDLGCECRELLVYQDDKSIIIIPAKGCPSA
jgi:hypothetical protein